MVPQLLGVAMGMPFLEQNRSAKVKEIYSALKRDHPDMPAEMKARIASRRGKKNAMSRKSPKDGGPKYKAPITAKYKAAMKKEAVGLNALKWGYRLGTPAVGAGTGALVAGEGNRLKGALAGGALGAGAGIMGAATGALNKMLVTPGMLQAHKAARLAGNPVARKKLVTQALGSPEAIGLAGTGTLGGGAVGGALMHKEEPAMDALQKRGSDLRNDIVNRAMSCGEAMEKTAAEQYFHDLRKLHQDVDMLGAKFCKLACGIGRDPWELALEVADHFPAYAVLSKTASDPKARELAEFYLDWSDEMEKTAFLGAIQKGFRVAKAGVGQAAKNVKGMTSSGKMQQAIAGGRKRSVGSAMSREAKNVNKLRAQGGGSVSRGENVIKQRQAEITAAKTPKTAPATTPATTPQPGPVQQGLSNAARTAIGGAAVAGAVGGPGYAYLKYQQSKQQPQAPQGYYR